MDTAPATITRADPTISARSLTEILDVTYRQLDYWCRIGLIHPQDEFKGSGSRRRFVRSDVAIADVIKGLYRAGANFAVTKLVSTRLYEDGSAPTGCSIIVTEDGDMLDPKGLMDLDSAPAFGWLIPLTAVARFDAFLAEPVQ